MSNGGSTNIAIEPQLPPNPMVVTVTKQNYYRYESNVDIISPSGPCVIADSFVINDASGNNNGLMDYGESIMLHMTMKNVSMAAANNVSTTMTSNNAYVTITNGNAYFGNIAPNSTVTVNNAFSFTVSPNIPDSHAVSFILNSTDGADNWISYISIVGHAPNIKFKQYVINDEGGNGNGLLDPGEIAPMIITVENQGSLTAYNVVGMLTTTDPNVTILTSQPQSMDDINAGGTSTCEFIVSASANIPAGYTADLTLNLNADFGVTQQTTFYLLFPDYCYPTANCSLGDGFNGFALEQINNMTGNGCSPNGYGDYTNMVADLQGGQKYTVQWRSGFSNQRASLWIDLNDNKEFESSEILINEFELLTPNQVYSTIFTVPEGDYTGYRRIRIRAHFHNTPPHPCVAYVYGETEDYTANFGNQATLAPPQNVAANVIGDSVVVTWQAPARADATLLGYNVYRDNTLLDMVTGNEYFDLDLPAGTYSYEVTAVYDQGESMPAGPVTVSILDPPTLLIAEQRGTKVFLKWKSNFVGKGVLADGSNKAKDFLDSYTGNTLTEDMQLRLFGGSYQSNQVHSDIRCEVECPAGAINESELCGEDLNGGCGSDPEVFESIAIGDVICGTVWADNGSRDTDWYELIVTESKIITWKVTAEFPVRVFILDGNNGCDDFGIIIYVFAQPCEPIIAMTTVIPGTYWLWVGNQDFYGNPCGESNNYVFELTAEDVFLPYFKLYRNDVVIGEIYDLYHYDDAIAPGNEYCYSVSEVVSEEGLETAKSNEICVNIPDGALAVTPGSLNETHSEPLQLTTKILTVSNTGNGPIEFDAVVDFLGKGNHASVAGPDREIDPKWVAEQYEQHAALERYPNPASDNVHNVKATAQPVGGEHYTSYITSDPSRAELYNNGPFITHPGGGAGGKGASAVQTNLGMSGLGYLVNHSASPGSYYYLADDFEVTGAWNLEEIKFYAYQTGSGATSTFTGVYVQIWDGAPNAGGVVVWGDLTKNRKISTKNISVYRVLDTGLQNTDHRIMEIVADMSGCILNAGTYWVQWGLTGSASSGPWGVPVTILGQTTTGNGLRATSTGWQNWQDGGTSTGQGGAFIIKGTSGQHIKDVGVLEISAPNTGYLTGAEEVKFIIKNYGIAAQYKIPWTVNVYGPDTSSLIGVYAGTLAPGATAEITAGMANLSTYGNYSFWACTHLTGDEHSGNNCEFKDVTIIGPFCVENLYSTGCSLGDGLTSWDFANSIVDIPCFGFLPWYHDYRDMVYEVERGHTYVLTVTAGSENTYFDVWIDFNDDFVFSNADELILNDGLCATANAPYTFNITIPVDAPGGTHVIRYRTNYFLPVTDPCATYDFGNATDFMVSIPPWISIEPSAGILNAGESMNVFVFFNSAGLDYGVYNADILFASNNPFITQPEVTVPVQLTVGGVPSQDILMPLGWSGWSAYINMLGASFENVVAPVVNDMIITQHFTEVFWPQYGINTMGNFTNDHGYVSKMSAFATLSLEGMVAAPTVALNAGWNLFPILVDCNLDAAEVFGGITGFIIGYEVAGNGIYYPAGSIATLTTLVPGKAYWVKVSGAATYTFPECVKGAKASYIAPLRHTNTTPWNEPTYTGSSHIVVFDAEASVSFAKGDMIGAFTNDGACAGLTLCDGKAVSLALFADDITTLVNDGFVQGEFITFKLYRQSNDTEYILDVSYSSQAPNYDGLFEANGLSVINNVTMYATGIGSQDLNSLTVYPNPSQGIFNVSVNNLFQDVNWVVTDAKGRYVMEGRLADSHQIDLRTQPKGIYFIKFTGDNVLCIKKLVLR